MNLTLSVTVELPGAPPKRAVSAHEPISGMNKHILIIDDDRSMRRAMRLLLESQGFDCKEADDGLEALDLLDAGLSVDVILSDYHMPVINGENFLIALANRDRADSANRVSVILLSGDMTKKWNNKRKRLEHLR